MINRVQIRKVTTTLVMLLHVFNASLKKAHFKTVGVFFKEKITREREVKDQKMSQKNEVKFLVKISSYHGSFVINKNAEPEK